MGSSVAVVSKVEALIARTTSDFKEEARTAAFHACRIIRENHLRVVAEVPHAAPAEPTPRTDGPAERPRMIYARFFSRCSQCGGPIRPEERCAWLKGAGIWDLQCWREVWK